MLKAELAAAEAQFAMQPADISAIRCLAILPRANSQLAETDTSTAAAAARERYLKFVRAQAAAHPENAALVGLWVESQRTTLPNVVAWTQRQIAAAQRRAEMIGRAAPLELHFDWIQGQPVSADDLKG